MFLRSFRTTVSFALVALLVAMPLVGVAGATGGSVTAVIASPANGGVFTRLGNVVFSDGSTHTTCAPNSWSWDFGDGGSATLQNPSHHYSALGTYTVTLTVGGECGASSDASITITIQNINPTAAASVTPSPAAAGSAITLSASASDLDGSVVEYRFSLDGTPFAPQAGNSLATTAPTLAGSHSVSVVSVDNDGGLSSASTITLNVVADALDSITIAGPDTLVAGSTASYTPSGFDQYGNAVALAVSSVSHTAGTTPGTESVSYTESGVTGSKSVTVIADDLFRIAVDGPDSLVAGTTGTYSLAGFDQYDNPLPLDQNTLDYTASTTAGSASVCYTEDGVSGCEIISVLPDALDSIVVSGAATLVAGEVGTYTLAGLDQYDNAVALAQSSLDFSATAAGPATVSYTESGVTGSLAITIVAAALDHITVTGPATLLVGTTGTYTLAGFDAYENPVALAQSSLDHTASNTAGTYTVSYTESGVTGSMDITVYADALFTIVIGGPSNPVAGTDVEYTFSGIDQHGNPVPLSPESGIFAINEAIGPQQICETQDGVTGCLTVNVVADALATIVLSGPSTLAAGTSAEYDLDGFDQYGNPVTLAFATLGYIAPETVGSYEASYTESGITGTHAVSVVAGPLASITLSGPLNVVAGSTNTYAADGFDQYGNAVTLADSSPAFVAPTTVGPATFTHTEGAVSGTIDVTVIADVLASITLDGPATATAGSMVMFTPSGFDQYGNPVDLSVAYHFESAQTTVGTQTFSYTEGGITGSTTVDIVADSLAQITITGPTSIAAGSTETYALAGADQYGNPVPLSQTSLDYTAPTAVGTATVSYSEFPATGTLDVTVVAAALDRIELSGPNQLVVGSIATYNLAGFDVYNNGVTLPEASFQYTAPNTVGSYTVSYTHAGVTGSIPIEVVADLPAYILVSGPDTLGVNEIATYAVSGYDIYSNPVTLDVTSIEYQAPTTMGSAQVCYTEDGVQGCKTIDVTAADLATITVTGAAELVVGTTETYALAGADVYGNNVPLAQTSLDFTAPTTAGPATVSYTESGITGTLDVSVVADALATILVSGPTSIMTGHTETFSVAGADQYANPVALDISSFEYTAPDMPGSYTVSYTEDGITGTLAITVVTPPIATIELTPATGLANVNRNLAFTAKAYDIDGVYIPYAPLTWSTDFGTITSTGVFKSTQVGSANVTVTSGAASATAPVTITDVLTVTVVLDNPDAGPFGQALRGTVNVRYADGTPASGATVLVTFHQEGPVSVIPDESASGSTNAAGNYRYGIIPLALIPGEYSISASASIVGNAGEDVETFTVEPPVSPASAQSSPTTAVPVGPSAKAARLE